MSPTRGREPCFRAGSHQQSGAVSSSARRLLAVAHEPMWSGPAREPSTPPSPSLRWRQLPTRPASSTASGWSRRAYLDFLVSPRDSAEASLLLCDGDGRTFVNYLGLLFDEPDGLHEELGEHRDTVVARLDAHRGDKHLWEKYRWVAEYHNAVIERVFGKRSDLRVDGSAMTWRFTPFA